MIFGLNPAHPQEPVPVGPLYFSSITCQAVGVSQYFCLQKQTLNCLSPAFKVKLEHFSSPPADLQLNHSSLGLFCEC